MKELGSGQTKIMETGGKANTAVIYILEDSIVLSSAVVFIVI